MCAMEPLICAFMGSAYDDVEMSGGRFTLVWQNLRAVDAHKLSVRVEARALEPLAQGTCKRTPLHFPKLRHLDFLRVCLEGSSH